MKENDRLKDNTRIMSPKPNKCNLISLHKVAQSHFSIKADFQHQRRNEFRQVHGSLSYEGPN